MASAWGKSWGAAWGKSFGPVEVAPPVPAKQADPFPYARALSPTLGRYTADPIIARMAQRTRRKARW